MICQRTAASTKTARNTHSAERLLKSLSSQSIAVSNDATKCLHDNIYDCCRLMSHFFSFSLPRSVPPDTRTIRTCGFEEGQYKNKCYQRSGFGGRQEVCACDNDLCNGAVTIKATLGVLLAAVVVFIARA
jgi:hypothetical protein